MLTVRTSEARRRRCVSGSKLQNTGHEHESKLKRNKQETIYQLAAYHQTMIIHDSGTILGRIIQSSARLLASSCALWTLSYCLIGGTSTGKTFYGSFWGGDKASVPLVAVTLPILLAGLAATLAVRSESEIAYSLTQRHRTKSSYNVKLPNFWHTTRSCRTRILQDGDPNLALWALWCIVLPCIILALTSIHRHLHSEKDLELVDAIKEVGNTLGYSALVALSIQLVPVARHAPLLRLWGCWNPVVAVQLHVWTGRTVMLLVSLHGALHMYRWSTASNMLGEGVGRMIIPPRQCFSISPGEGYFQPTCLNKATDCTCYDFVRNWTGLLAGLTLLLIGLSSLNFVRRTFFALFYKIHTIAGPTMLLLVVLHWNRSILFLAGSALYYTACSFPVFWEQQQRNKESGGVRIVAVERIQSLSDHYDSRPCMAVTVEASDLALQQFRAGQYVQLKAPAVSDIAHPFTINTVPRNPRQLQIIFRCVGPFTRQLAKNFLLTAVARSCDAEEERRLEHRMPELYLDGFHGSPDRLQQVLKHDVVMIVAGGIGITPYLSLLQRVQGFATSHNSIMTKQLFLHWSCRDPDLIDFVKREHFDAWLSESFTTPAAKLRIQIVIHKTAAAADLCADTFYSGSEISKQDQLGEFSCDRVDSLICVPPKEQHGVAFSPSRCGPKNTYRGNLVSFVSSLLTMAAGLAGILYSYFQLQSTTTTLPRLVGPLFVLVVGALMALGSHEVSRHFGFDQVASSAEFEPLDTLGCDDEEQFSKEATVELKEASSFRFQNKVASGLDQHYPTTGTARDVCCGIPKDDDMIPFVQLKERVGRASLHQLLNALENAERPGLFACGPSTLLADLRDVTQKRCLLRLQRCATAGKPPIALYEESFEI